VIGIAVRALATIPVIGGLWALIATATEVLPAIGVSLLLLAYLIGWQRVEAGGGLPRRVLVSLAAPLAAAVATLLLAMVVAVSVTVDDDRVAILAAVAGMAAAIGAVAVAIRPALRRRS
jgi:hypothetical protein